MNKYRELRQLTGLSAQKFGDKYGIPLRTVQGWEMETSKPPEYVFSLLERAVHEDMKEYETPTAPDHAEPDVEQMKELCDLLIDLIRRYD